MPTDEQRKSVPDSIDRAWSKWHNELEANSPQRDDFHFERYYNRSSKLHSANGSRGKSFFETLKIKLQEAIKRLTATEPYKPVMFEWQTKYGLWGDAKTTEAIAKLEADVLEELLQDLEEYYKQLQVALDANFPNDAPASHHKEWQKNRKQLADSYNDARDIISKALNERRLADAKKLYSEPPTDAADVIARIEQLRVNEPGQKEADRLNEEAIRLTEDINEIAPIQIECERLTAEIDKLKRQLWRVPAGDERDKVKDELERVRKEYYEQLEERGKYRRKEKLHAEGWEKVERFKQLAVLFPNRGGDTFFSDDFRKEALKKFKKRGLEDVAKEVFELYDIIARAYNTGGKKFDPPTGVKFVRAKKYSGRFNDGIIEINANDLTPFDVRETFAHELGHWLEMWALGGARCTINAEWLFSEQKCTTPKKVPKEYYVPNREQPNLCASTDNYSQRYYGVGYVNSTDVGAVTELISTAIEHLVRDPELFARRCPKHLALLLENLSDLSK